MGLRLGGRGFCGLGEKEGKRGRKVGDESLDRIFGNWGIFHQGMFAGYEIWIWKAQGRFDSLSRFFGSGKKGKKGFLALDADRDGYIDTWFCTRRTRSKFGKVGFPFLDVDE